MHRFESSEFLSEESLSYQEFEAENYGHHNMSEALQSIYALETMLAQSAHCFEEENMKDSGYQMATKMADVSAPGFTYVDPISEQEVPECSDNDDIMQQSLTTLHPPSFYSDHTPDHVTCTEPYKFKQETKESFGEESIHQRQPCFQDVEMTNFIDDILQREHELQDNCFIAGSVQDPLPSCYSQVDGQQRTTSTDSGHLQHNRSRSTGRLWIFIRDLLLDQENINIIRWEDRQQGVFRIVKSSKVANRWGIVKNNVNMTYDKLSRALRYNYISKTIEQVKGRRLVYKFGPKSYGWRE